MTSPAVSFAHPWLGLAAALIAVLLTLLSSWLHRRGRFLERSLSHPKTLGFASALTHHFHWRPGARAQTSLTILRLVSLTCLALAAARPQRVSISQIEPLAGVDIILSIDTSSSMQALDFQPFNRLQAAKKIAVDFVEKRKGDRIGLVTFGGSAIISCPLTLDRQAAISFIEQIEIGMTQTEGTAIGSGLMTSILHLRKVPSASKIVILLTDGRNNAGSVDPITAAKTAESLGIKVYTIGAGKRGGGIYQVTDPIFGTRLIRRPEEEIDEATLTKIADITSGRYYRAAELAELKSVFSEIDRLEKNEFEPPKTYHYEELYPPLLLAALFLLGTETFLRATILLTLP
ncbi:MAG: VWA domain-containing protein [Elusimicrobia bacterium]|nr:VWA domain-containing protein [Elusimicrobiota bacterium]